VRRASAISVLAAICFSLIAPLALADTESNLPACCRRKGAHHCAMSAMMAGGNGTPAMCARCPAYPIATAAQPGGTAAPAGVSQLVFAELLSHPAVSGQTEARARISFSRSRQKRGPPVSPFEN